MEPRIGIVDRQQITAVPRQAAKQRIAPLQIRNPHAPKVSGKMSPVQELGERALIERRSEGVEGQARLIEAVR
jgi:hypothetical protein